MPIEVVVLTGIPGSGKSTLAKNLFSSYTRVNLDTLKSRAKEKQAILRAFEKRESVIIDNTNITRNIRARYVEIARANKVKIRSILVNCTLERAISNNRQRAGRARVPDFVVKIYNRKLQPPSIEEGFESCEIIDAFGFQATNLAPESARPQGIEP